MQSQQKRVKWSRGETAEALEERTDTGITQASVELMENCIPDIYGNVSRRPGLKIITSVVGTGYSANIVGFSYDKNLQVIPFYITEDDYVLVGVNSTTTLELIRIKNNIAVYRTTVIGPKSTEVIPGTANTKYSPVSYSQQNNYMIIADAYNLWKLTLTSINNDGTFTASCETLKYSAGWYAPNGTQTKAVSNIGSQQLAFNGKSICGYTYTDYDTSTTTQYSAIWVGFGTSYSEMAAIESEIPRGSIIHMPNIGCYMRIEGYFAYVMPFGDTVFDGVLNPSDNVPSTGTYCKCPNAQGTTLQKFVNGTLVSQFSLDYKETTMSVYVQNSASSTGYSRISYSGSIPTHFTAWTVNASFPGTQSIWAYGSLLTPVSDEEGIDNTVTVEYGYESLQPTSWNAYQNYPHPRRVVFSQQRLWAGEWQKSSTVSYPITIGSQIARYNDFKNDYNQANEPITVDILTQYKEKILHLVDYNGLKIMTDSYEYAYDTNTGVQKQSANGSFEYCEPIVFDSLCLYVDSTGCQVKAMQYEFQANIFNSSTINQLAPHDLVWYPSAMAQYEDKYNSTGKYLFLVNRYDANAHVAVCNFVPGNQAEIWNRWKFPKVSINGTSTDFVHSVVNLKDGVLFMVNINRTLTGTPTTDWISVPAVLDFNKDADTQSTMYSFGGTNYFAPVYNTFGTSYGQFITCPNTKVNVYSNGEFKLQTTTGSNGQITADLTGLTNITIGLPINATIRSHPIDVGGKTKTIKKRIGKSVLSVHNTEPNAIIINGKTGYMNPQKDKINFYGVTGMKDEIKYTITNTNGARFTIESLTMNIEYGTLIS